MCLADWTAHSRICRWAGLQRGTSGSSGPHRQGRQRRPDDGATRMALFGNVRQDVQDWRLGRWHHPLQRGACTWRQRGAGQDGRDTEPIKNQFPDISYADLYILAGATALKTAGVPVPFKAGRVDAMSPDAVTPDGACRTRPRATTRRRLRTRSATTCSIAWGSTTKRSSPSLVRTPSVAVTPSGYSGPWSPTPYILNNGYFNLLNLPWTIKQWDGPMQFEDPAANS